MTTAIDLFAGAGGFTEGAIAAGVDVILAANHWRASVDIHAANHPGIRHSCQDLQQADFGAFPDHDIMLAAPACQGHSTAGQPGRKMIRAVADTHQADRNTAWAIIAAAEAKRPRTILVENVTAFYRWALYPAWRSCLETLGYTVAEHRLDAADFGVPQNRKRAIITARIGEALDIVNPGMPHAAFAPHVDWDADGMAPVAGKPIGARRRVEAGRARGLGDRFITHYGWSGHRGRELDRPIGTITTKIAWGVVDGDDMRMLTIDEHRRAMGFRADYQLPATKKEAVRMLGNAIAPTFARALVEQAAA